MSPRCCHSHIKKLPILIVYHIAGPYAEGCRRCERFSGKLFVDCNSSVVLYISINFHKHILNGSQLIQRKQNYCQTSKGNN